MNAPAPAIVQMCRWLNVSKSGFYEWRSRPESTTAQRRALLKIKSEALFYANDDTYGYRRMHQALVRGGEQAGVELVRKLMRELGLEPCQPKPWRHSLTEQGPSGPIPDLVNRDFTAAMPGEKMAGDITYIPTWEGWVYLALVIDCATRMIVGWAMDDNYKTPLITAAVTMAARNVKLPEGAVFHSDRGHLKKIGSRWRKLPPGKIALIVLATLRHDHRLADMAGGNGVSASTGHRWTWEVITLLAARAPRLDRALAAITREGGEVVLLDGTFPTRRRAGTANRKNYNGNHKKHGLLFLALTDQAGNLTWISPAHRGDASEITAARHDHLAQHLRAAGLGAFADLGSTGLDPDPDDPVIITGYKSTRTSKTTPAQRHANQALSAARAPVEHGKATTLLRTLLVLTLQHTTR